MFNWDEVEKLEEKGYSDIQISVMTGHSYCYLSHVRKRKNMPRKYPAKRMKKGSGFCMTQNLQMKKYRKKNKENYVVIKVAGKFYKEHVYIAEKVLGRRLNVGEVVHHIDGNQRNNRNDNLIICTQDYHINVLHSERGNTYIKSKKYRRSA